MWTNIKKFFKDSETIAWARIQAALGVAVLVLTFVDPGLVTAVIPIEWVPGFLLANGLAT